MVDMDTAKYTAGDVLRVVPDLNIKELSRLVEQGYISPKTEGEGKGARRFYTRREIYWIAFITWIAQATGSRITVKTYLEALSVLSGNPAIVSWNGEGAHKISPSAAWEEIDHADFLVVIPGGEPNLVKEDRLLEELYGYCAAGKKFLVVPLGYIKLDVDQKLP